MSTEYRDFILLPALTEASTLKIIRSALHRLERATPL
jgi:hypothetical protein|tara:strand:- start:58 stop:168 length:111 start_codon:yes stop_codon:yes gene_type:complete